MKEKDILKALQTGVIAAIAASSMPLLPVKYLGRNEPTNSGKWLELVHIPNNMKNTTWGNEKVYRGILRLILHWPQDDKGNYESLTLLSAIADYFNKGRILTSNSVAVQIYENPDLTGIGEQSPQSLLYISIWYRSFQQSA